jgi:glutamyl-tRNA synthetase
VIPRDAAPWTAIVYGELAPLDSEGERILGAAGADFFQAAARAHQHFGADLKALAQAVKESTGRKGAELYMPLRVALTGLPHGPELAPLLKLMPAATVQKRLAAAAIR